MALGGFVAGEETACVARFSGLSCKPEIFRSDPSNQAIFRTELHSLINDARLGTLFVDTTPNRPGVQYFFRPSSMDNP